MHAHSGLLPPPERALIAKKHYVILRTLFYIMQFFITLKGCLGSITDLIFKDWLRQN